ncbi:beta-lactamase class A [Saccharothrix tamanrassetensis]|uniref:Beta-lactamase class A n=1 Tax=Saccharothrix tamanrassetensis TaxID=1051531 RepID=A0A841CJI6_9PSEU|nr:serine hydrolase [Saccharothrix tamanrassetensis]MBB5958642.1 beta-lactamase class A [Saccharothrix tamanrassetensis]
METAHEVVDEIRRRAAEVGVRVWLHAADLDGPRRVDVDGAEPVVSASVFKVPVAVELARQGAAGLVDLGERITYVPGTGTDSPYGLATYRHEVTISWHDLAVLMIGISDNVATDLVVGRIGLPAVARLLTGLGFTRTAVPYDCDGLFRTVRDDLGDAFTEDAFTALSREEYLRLRILQPEHTCRTTAEETTRLLGMVWRDEAAPAEACADVRNWLGLQVWPHRLRSGFHEDGVRVSGKTGTLPMVRNEAGVVEFPDGGRYAVGVFTQAHDTRVQAPERDAFIGFAASRAIDWLRA